jgi:hypothetical protein
MHRVLPGYPSPTIFAVVELEEGFVMNTNLVDCDEGELRCDLPVEVTFEDMTDEYALPLFRVVRNAPEPMRIQPESSRSVNP